MKHDRARPRGGRLSRERRRERPRLAARPRARAPRATLSATGSRSAPSSLERRDRERPARTPLASRCSRARSGSNRSAMSGVWPCSAGGTTPPVATTRFAGTRARERVAIDRVRERAPEVEVRRARDPRGRTPRYPDHAAGPSARRVAARRHQVGEPRRVAHRRRCRARPRSYRLDRVGDRRADELDARRRCRRERAMLGRRASARAGRPSARRSGTRRSRPASGRSTRPRPPRSRAAAAARRPGRFITLMKYGAGATSRNSTVRSSSARTPMRSASSLLPQVVVLRRSPARSRSRPTSPARRGRARA